jgi:hypothetical protein
MLIANYHTYKFFISFSNTKYMMQLIDMTYDCLP